MKIWTSISQIEDELRWRRLGHRVRAAGVENEFRPWVGDAESLESFAPLAEFNHVRISGRLSARLLRSLNVQSSWITLLGVTDGALQTDRGWWPLCALYEALGRLLIERGPQLDMRGSVMIAGTGANAQAAIAAFFRAGFQKFLVASLNADVAQAMITEVRGRFFGLQVEWIPIDRIVLLPGETSVFVNCLQTDLDSALASELSYLNFLKRPGHLFDLGHGEKALGLVGEAAEAGVQIVSALDIANRTDLLWAKWAFGVDLDLHAVGELNDGR